MSALSEHKLLIFKTLFLLYTQHKNRFSKFTEYIVEFFYKYGIKVPELIFSITDEQKIMDVIQDKNTCYEITQHEFNPKNQLKLN